MPSADQSELLDLAIIGSGPAALTAAIYAARAGLKATVFERNLIGGAVAEIPKIANFPGFTGVGKDLAEAMKTQAIDAGAKIEYGECTSILQKERAFYLTIDDEPVIARSVILATGSEPRIIPLNTDLPISTCALCDAPLYKGKNVLVIGGGNSAVSESLMLADLARHLILINRSPLRAEKTLLEKLKSRGNIEIHENLDPSIDSPELQDIFSRVDGIFLFIGKQPASDLARNLDPTLIDADGYIITNSENMTAVPGLFAAGDIRVHTTKQAITAAADGAVAATSVKNFLTK